MSHITDVYKTLRSEIFGRHFAVGRHFPAYHFVSASLLGEWPACALPQAGKKATIRCDTGACFPRTPVGTAWHARYNSPQDLLDLPSDPGDPRQFIERWRIWRRDRTNPFLIGALRVSALCVEWSLGLEASGVAIERWLETVEALFHFKHLDSPMAGYFLRYHAVTSDAWESEIDSKGNERPLRPCEFLANPDPRTSKDRPYLYCTPTNDSRYRDAAAASHKGRDRYRHWEPSMDEITGLVVAHLMIFQAFQPDLTSRTSRSRRQRANRIVPLIKQQMRRVARYLQAHAYVLVRPCGGFTFRGASENNPCLEYAFSCAFKRVLGETFPVTATVEDAFVTAGVFHAVFPEEAGLPQVRADLLARLASAGVLARLQQFLPPSGAHDPLTGSNALTLLHLKRAAQIVQHEDQFDVYAGHGAEGPGAQMASCYLLSKLARPDPKRLLAAWLSVHREGEAAYKVLLGLIGHVTQDRTIVDGFHRLYAAMLHTIPASQDDLSEHLLDMALANAIAMLLASPGSPPRTVTGARMPAGLTLQGLRSSLVGRLESMARQLAVDFRGQPVVSTNDGGAVVEPKEETARCCAGPDDKSSDLVFEFDDKVTGYHGFIAATALAWRHSKMTQSTAPWPAMPVPSAADLSLWPSAMLPRALLDRADAERLPIPAVYRTSALGARDIDLLTDTAPRPPRETDVGEPEVASGDVHVLQWRWKSPIRKTGVETRNLPAPPAAAGAAWLETHQLHAVLMSVQTFKAQLGDPEITADGQVKVRYSLESFEHLPLGEAKIDAELVVSWVRMVQRST